MLKQSRLPQTSTAINLKFRNMQYGTRIDLADIIMDHDFNTVY